VQPRTDVLSLQLSCTNRELPTFMSVGAPSGDLFLEGGASVRSIRLLRKPTQPWRFDHRGDGQWRIISHLALNHLSLTGSGLAAFQEMLALYDLPRSATTRRQIEGLRAIEHSSQTVWMPGQPFACFVRGLEVRLTWMNPALSVAACMSLPAASTIFSGFTPASTASRSWCSSRGKPGRN
jgi:type VI secretion system protein ImpG